MEYVSNVKLSSGMNIYDIIGNIVDMFVNVKVKFISETTTDTTQYVKLLFFYDRYISSTLDYQRASTGCIEDADSIYKMISDLYKSKVGKKIPLKFISEEVYAEIYGMSGRNIVTVERTYELKTPDFKLPNDYVWEE